MKISLSVPHFFGNELYNLKKCVKKRWISSSGSTVTNFEKGIKNYIGAKYALGIINCTSALQLSVRLLNPKPKDEIIVPSITFIASVNAIIYNNCKPIFLDCDENLLLDTQKTLEFLKTQTFQYKGDCYNKKTKKRILGVIAVHTFGNLVKLNKKFLDACKRKNIKIIEDAAESLGSYYNSGTIKKHAATLGDLNCLSFNANKIITSGGGGMIIFKDKSLYKRGIYLSAQAKDNSTYFVHNDVGYNFRLSSLHSSIGLAQISKISKIIKKKKVIHNYYKKEINKINGLKILEQPNYCTSNFWLNILVIDKKKYGLSKDQIIKNFLNKKIETRSVWHPNHLQSPFKNFQKYKIKNSKKLYENCVCLPSSFNLRIKDQIKVINFLKKKFK
jgi:perosamine synthetase